MHLIKNRIILLGAKIVLWSIATYLTVILMNNYYKRSEEYVIINEKSSAYDELIAAMMNIITDARIKSMKLKKQNQHLMKRVNDTFKDIIIVSPAYKRLLNNINDDFIYNNNIKIGPTLDYENARRRMKANVENLWHYLHKELDIESKYYFNQIKETLIYDIEIVSQRDAEWRKRRINQLTSFIKSKISGIQNPVPKNKCFKAKKLICKMAKSCNFSCKLHHAAYCMITALATNRILFLDTDGWMGDSDDINWNSLFSPITGSCLKPNLKHSLMSESIEWGEHNEFNSEKILFLPDLAAVNPRPSSLPQTLPERITEIINLHGDPFAWFIGTVLRYLMTPTDSLLHDIHFVKDKISFSHPIVGICHMNQNVNGNNHSLSEFMLFAEQFFSQFEFKQKRIFGKKSNATKRLIYLSSNVDEWKTEIDFYAKKGYVFLSDSLITEGSYIKLNPIKKLVINSFLLSSCDHLICSFKSEFCRLVYELMQNQGYHDNTRWMDMSDSVTSIEGMYHFDGQNDVSYFAVSEFHSIRENFSLKVGDRIVIEKNNFNGFYTGYNKRSGKRGSFPAYKIQRDFDIFTFEGLEEPDD